MVLPLQPAVLLIFDCIDDAVRTALHAPLSSVKQWFWTDYLDMDLTNSDGNSEYSYWILAHLVTKSLAVIVQPCV